jgi:hypothetical protein
VHFVARLWRGYRAGTRIAACPTSPIAMKNASRRHVLIAFAAPAATGAFAADRGVRGSGREATERRAVNGFDRIAIAGSFEVEIRQGTQEGVELTGDDNLLALIETRIEGAPDAATLKIGPKNDARLEPSQPIRVHIDLIHLSGIELGGASSIAANGLHAGRLGVSIGGAGRVVLAGLEAERLTVDIGGSGHVKADGRAKGLAISIGGSGSCELVQLVVDDAKIDIAGSGRQR